MSHSQLRECHLICRSKLHADSRFPLRLDNFVQFLMSFTLAQTWQKKLIICIYLYNYCISIHKHTVYISSFWHVMTSECLIRAHGFNNAWVRERERGRACTPTRSNCLRNKTEQTSSLRKSLQENKLVTRLTPLTVLLFEAHNNNNTNKKSPLQISLYGCEVFFHHPVWNAYQKERQSHNLPCRWHRGTREEKALFSSRAGLDCIHKPHKGR